MHSQPFGPSFVSPICLPLSSCCRLIVLQLRFVLAYCSDPCGILGMDIDSCGVQVVRCNLLGSADLPVYRWQTAEVGKCFFWEQRYWLQALGIVDQVDYRKREKRQGHIPEISASWALFECDYVPGGRSSAFKTPLMSTSLLLPWLCAKFRHFVQGRDVTRGDRCTSALIAWFDLSRKGLALCPSAPELTVLGVTLSPSRDGFLSLHSLVAVYPALSQEWNDIVLRAHHLGLPAFPANATTRLTDLFLFLEARSAYSPDLAPGHWLVSLRNSLLVVVVFCAEVAVCHQLEADRDLDASKRNVPTLYGRTGKRQARSSIITRMQWLRRVQDTPGSAETVLRTLSGSVSYAAMIRNVSSRIYAEGASSLFRDSASLSLSWDGAGYSGLTVNVAFALNCNSGHAAHIRPQVGSALIMI